MSACTHTGLSPTPMVIWCPWNSNIIQCESTNQEWEWWPNVWMSTLLNARYYYTPSSVLVLLFSQSAWIQGSNDSQTCSLSWTKPVGLGPGWFQTGTILSGGGTPSLAQPYKSPDPSVMSGEAGWTAGSTHLHHVLGTSQVWACTLTERYELQLHH